MTRQTEQAWRTTNREEVYRGRVRLVDHAVEFADGTRSHYEVDESIPFAVATLVIDGDAVILTRQYRYPIDRWIYDLPGGAGTDGETPAEAASREVEEELGLVPNELVSLHTFYVNPGRAAWPVHVFVRDSGTRNGTPDRSDLSEQVRLVRLSVRDLDAAITSGEVVDPALLVARAAAAVRGFLPPLTPAAG
ncbi:ADP-ribose pyrophosphatase [Frondihabitans sucicola]|uniref:ADP-ribose pyrophosphatase n=1 Tax=Frondihabitans sucicola TaxID=1268041 RepID=A0ABN6XZM8_9MICO|nr:NUDIX hydrolase [Frondihabitans sucicola]BDZ50226.1 ADP-ribose pyrophosphatase [Frondihabitans sucicola]